MVEVQGSLLDTMFDRMPIGIAVFDRDLRLVRCNDRWAEFVRAHSASPPPVEPGAHVFDLLPDIADWAKPIAERVLAGETVRVDPLEMASRGRVSYWDAVFAPLFEDGRVAGIVEMATDATERVLARRDLEARVEERTRELERRQEVAEGLHHILDILNGCCPEEQVLDYIIAETRRLLGSEAISVYRLEVEDGILRMRIARGVDDEAVGELEIPVLGGGYVGTTIMERKPLVMPDAERLLETARVQMPPEQVALLEGVVQRYRAILAVPLVVNGEVYGALTAYYPKTREFSDEDVELAGDLADHLALAIENARLRDSAEEAAVVAERNRLARDLHDAVTQTLFSASLIAEVLPQLWERDPEEGRRRLAQMRELTRGALAEMRTLLLELRPAALEDANLGELLRQLAEAMTARCGVEVHVRTDGEGALPSDVRVALYRIAQEALNNVAKHSGASSVEVSLGLADGCARLAIADNGRGFESSDRSSECLGLGIMRERADAIGALLEISTEPGRGTSVIVSWPK